MNRVRARGRVVSAPGIGVTGRAYFYPKGAEKAQHWAILPADGGAPAPALYGTVSAFTNIDAALVGPDRDEGVGYFDVPDGLPPGEYYIEVHAGNAITWAWPYVVPVSGVTDVPEIRIGGPGGAVPANRTLVLFGDSDSATPWATAERRLDFVDLLSTPTITVINRAEGNLPVGTSTLPDGGGTKRSGLDVVRRACTEIPVIHIAVLRFGLNDAHYYLTPPLPSGIAKFRSAYAQAIDMLKAKGAVVMCCEVILEGGDRDPNADIAINTEIRKLCAEKGCILVEVDIDARNDPQNYVSNSDNVHLTNAGARVVADLIKAKIPAGVPGPTEPPPVTGGFPAITPLAKQFTKGTFTASFSEYGLLGAPMDRIERDLAAFRKMGFGNVRVWIDWGTVKGHEQPDASVFDKDGNFIEPIARKLDEALTYGQSIGMSFDLTMHADHYRSFRDPNDNEKYDISAHKKAVRLTLQRWGKHPAFRIFDMANEAEVRGGSPGSGSPATGHVSPGRFTELMETARSVPHACLVSCSISGGGDNPGDVPANYVALFRGSKGDILLPHFARKSGWGVNEGPNAKKLATKIAGLPIHHQEPARNSYNGQNWPVSEFEASFKSAKAAGSVGCCFHTGAGFDVRTKDAWDQLDAVERQVVANLLKWIA